LGEVGPCALLVEECAIPICHDGTGGTKDQRAVRERACGRQNPSARHYRRLEVGRPVGGGPLDRVHGVLGRFHAQALLLFSSATRIVARRPRSAAYAPRGSITPGCSLFWRMVGQPCPQVACFFCLSAI
jgi:hypothetical protein